MATIQQLEMALINADKAGDTDAARKLAAVLTRARARPENRIPNTQVPETIVTQPEPTFIQKVGGAGEAVATVATGATLGSVGLIGGALKGMAEQILSGNFGTPEATKMVETAAIGGAEAMTYKPRGQAGQEMVESIGNALQFVPPVIPVIGPVGAAGRSIANVAPIVEATGRSVAATAAPIVQRGARAAAQIPKSIGQAIYKPDLPVGESVRRGGSIGADATGIELQRLSEAEMAGLKLTEGEIKRSPELLSWEKEKAKTAEYQAPFVERQQANNRSALMRFEQWIDDTGAETGDVSNTGVKVVDALLSGYGKEKQRTTQLYNAFRESPEARSMVDHSNVIAALNDQPVGVAGITGVTDTARQNAVRLGVARLDESGQLVPLPTTLGKLEELRQSVSAIGSSTPNDKRLVSMLKREIDAAGDPVGGSLTKAMRAQRQKQAVKYENRAIVSRLLLEKRGMDDPQVPIEEVFNKTILSAKPSEIQHIKRVLVTTGGDEGAQAWRELQGATIRHILDAAESGIGADNLPVISSAKLDRVIKNLDKNGKLDLVLGKQQAEQVRNINQVLKYIQSTPPMTNINNSGTARTVLALLAEAGITGAATGIPLPIVQGVKMLRDSVKDRRIKERINASLNYSLKKEQP